MFGTVVRQSFWAVKATISFMPNCYCAVYETWRHLSLIFYVIRFSYFQLIVMTVFESKCFFYKLDNLVLIFLIGFLFSCWPMRSHNKPYFGDFFDNFFDNLLDDFLRNFLTYNLLTVASFRIGVPSIMFLLNESGVAFSVAC